MKKFQKIMSLMLASAMIMTMLAGCSNSNDASNADSSTAETTEAAGEETAEGTNEAASNSGAAFKIGAIGPATGGAAVYGIAVQNGADLAIKEINAAGGINGYQIEYNFRMMNAITKNL